MKGREIQYQQFFFFTLVKHKWYLQFSWHLLTCFFPATSWQVNLKFATKKYQRSSADKASHPLPALICHWRLVQLATRHKQNNGKELTWTDMGISWACRFLAWWLAHLCGRWCLCCSTLHWTLNCHDPQKHLLFMFVPFMFVPGGHIKYCRCVTVCICEYIPWIHMIRSAGKGFEERFEYCILCRPMTKPLNPHHPTTSSLLPTGCLPSFCSVWADETSGGLSKPRCAIVGSVLEDHGVPHDGDLLGKAVFSNPQADLFSEKNV